MTSRASTLRRLRQDDAAAAIPELALIAPVMLFLLLGLVDLARVANARSALEAATNRGARQASATDCPAERPDRLAMAVAKAMRAGLGSDGTKPTVETKSYADRFGDVGAPEPYVDDPAAPNGVHDPGESFTDVNGNGQWDADMGVTGSIGGAGDVVSYTVTYRVRPLMPFLVALVTGQDHYPIRASTLVRNEPVFDDRGCAP